VEPVRLYGVTKTNTSWGRVTAGVREGLGDLGRLAGFVPVDDLTDDGRYEGYDAPIAIYAGPPSMVAAMSSYGEHQRRYAILAPNSDWLPEKLVREMQKFATIVAPSSWGARIVANWTGKYVEPFLHGVSKVFRPVPDHGLRLRSRLDLEAIAREIKGGRFASREGFCVLHLASTWRQRKGTMELIAGWKRAVASGSLGKYPRLDIVVDAPPGTFEEARGDDTIAFPLRQVNYQEEAMRLLYSAYDVVCQPSRAEGFGLVPLEARATGVPVCATACTGHADHVRDGAGVVVIPHGPLAPVDDAPLGESSEAPTVKPEAIADALAACYETLPQLCEQAYTEAARVASAWSWASTTDCWLRKEREWT